jgi:hypothetical protein
MCVKKLPQCRARGEQCAGDGYLPREHTAYTPVKLDEVPLLGGNQRVAYWHEDGCELLLLHVLEDHHLTAFGLNNPAVRRRNL